MPGLFDPYTLRGITLRNRIGVSPMCQYIAGTDGVPTDWHLAHLGARAVGGAALVMTEVAAVEARGRIGPGDVGIWNEAQVSAWKRITDFLRANGAVPAMQIGHAGRKASVYQPWMGEKALAQVPASDNGWDDVVAASGMPLRKTDKAPHELTVPQIKALVKAFGAAADRAHRAGFDWLEMHGAHGYLMAGFLSPYSNKRTDEYGGSLENRTRFALECAAAMRAAMPERKVLAVRLSSTEFTEEGQTIENTVQVAKLLKAAGVDLIDCSAGIGAQGEGFPKVPMRPGYLVPYSERIRREAVVPTAAVGLITEPFQAESIIRDERADLVLIGRAFLREPYWAVKAAETLGAMAGPGVAWPLPYGYAVVRR